MANGPNVQPTDTQSTPPVTINPHTEEVIIDDTPGALVENSANPDANQSIDNEATIGKEISKENAKENKKQDKDKTKLLAGKYKTEEDLQKGLLELLKKQTKAESLEDLYKTLEKGKLPVVNNEKSTEQPIDSQATQANLDVVLDEYTAEYLDNGRLSEESLKELKNKLGNFDVPDELITMALEGRKAKIESYTSQLFELAGGEEQYKQMLSWAKANLTPEEQEAFDTAIVSMNPSLAKLVLDGLKARAETEAPSKLITNSTAELGIGGPSDVYTSAEEVWADMSKDEYYSNPQFAARVRAKLARSNLNLEQLF